MSNKTKAMVASTREAIKGAKPPKVVPNKPAKNSKNLAPEKLLLLVTIVNRNKAEYFSDLIQSFHCNLQLGTTAVGTASKALGLLTPDVEKEVIFSVMSSTYIKQALETLETKFHSIRGGSGVAFTVPMTCTIGKLIYRFLADKQ